MMDKLFESEPIYMPYSFYSLEGHEIVLDRLREMGYDIVKTYPEDEE